MLWARIAGITLASLSALANFFFIPFYPFRAFTVITLGIFVIWALAAHGKALAEGWLRGKPRSGMATARSAPEGRQLLRRRRATWHAVLPGAGAARFTLPRVIPG